MQYLDARFKVVPGMVKMSATTTTIASATATHIKGTTIDIPSGLAGDGLAVRYRVAGTKTGTNAAHVIACYVDGTAVLTLTQSAATAVDWMAEITVFWVNKAVERSYGLLIGHGLGLVTDYATGSVNCSAGVSVDLRGTSHASDSLTIDMVSVESWIYEPTATT